MLQLNVHYVLQKQLQKAWYNKLICTDSMERKLSEIFGGFRRYLDVKLDYGCLARKM